MGVEALLTVGGAFLGAGGGSKGGKSAAIAAGLLIADWALADPLEGPRLERQLIQSASQGTPLPKNFGTWRQGMSIIHSKITEHAHTESGGSGGPDVTTYTYTLNAVLVGGEGPISRVNSVQFGGKKIWSYDGAIQHSDPAGISLTFDSDHGTSPYLRVYYGTETQPQDSLMQAVYGADNAPALLGTWYIVIEGYDITEFGGQFPEITVEAYNSTVALDDIVTYLVTQCGRTADDVDATALAGLAVDQYNIPTRTNALSCLQELMDIYQFDVQEVDGIWKCVLRDRAPSRTISYQKLRWHEPGSAIPGVAVSLRAARALPESYEFNFLDTNRRNAAGMRRASLQAVPSTGKRTATYNWGGTGPQAEKIAQILLSEEWIAGKKSFTVNLGVCDLDAAAGDVVTIVTPYGSRLAIIDELSTPLFGIQGATLVSHDRGVYSAPLGATTTGVGQSLVNNYHGFYYSLIDTNALFDELTARTGFYIASTLPDAVRWQAVNWSNPYFPRGLVNSGWDRLMNKVPQWYACTMGEVTAVTNYDVDMNVIDNDNVIQVDLVRGTLSSTDDDGLLRGANAMFLGKEIIQFKTATYIDEIEVPGQTYTLHRYELTGLLRGRRGTDNWYLQGHTTGEAAVLLDGAVVFAPIEVAALQQEIEVTTTAPGGTPLAVTITPVGRTLMPWPVCYVTAERDVSENLTVSYTRRSKLTDTSLITGAEAPDAYGDLALCDIEILNGVGVVLRAFTSDTDSFEYSAADQVTDFGSAQASVTVRITQRNSIVGAGYSLTIDI